MKKSPDMKAGLLEWAKKALKGNFIAVYSIVFAGIALIVAANIPNKYISKTVKPILESIGVALSVGSLSVVIDHLLFTSEIQKSLSKIEKAIGIVDVGIEKVFRNGIAEFCPELFEGLKEGDKLTILETFVDLSTTNFSSGKPLEKLLAEKVQLKLICLRHHKDAETQIRLRAKMSREKRYVRNHIHFWDVIADFCEDHKDLITAKEISFLPSVSIYQVEYKDPRKPREVYFTPIVGGDSDVTHYFKIHPDYLELPLPKKIIDYLGVCEEDSNDFTHDIWNKRKKDGQIL